MKTMHIALAFGFACAALAAPAQAVSVLKSYNLEVYKGDALVLSGTFSVNVEADTANVSVYDQQASLASADLSIGTTAFTLANTGLLRNGSPGSYDDPYLYNLYGVSANAPGSGVSNKYDDFSFQFNPYKGTYQTDHIVYNIAGQGGSAFSDRVVLTEAAAVPEPATWAMMLAGFGAMGYAMRRRRIGYRVVQTA